MPGRQASGTAQLAPIQGGLRVAPGLCQRFQYRQCRGEVGNDFLMSQEASDIM
jgi:hypothetical protein